MPDVKLRIENSIGDIKVDAKGVDKLQSELQPEKACGPDAIPNQVLKNCSKALAPGIAVLFQKSLDSGQIPTGPTQTLLLY